MALFLSLEIFLVLTLISISLSMAFTVIMSDSNAPPSLVDTPQTGFSMGNKRARTDAREQEAVYEIMRATGNEWATEIPDVCRGRWHGIECMPDKDNVFHIVSLSFGALSDDTAFPTCDPTRSYISPSITKLPHLRTLFFYRCFSDNPQPVPAFLGRLGPALKTLVLRENGHVGPIPNELGNLTRLTVLDLHQNNLNGSIPISLGRITGLRSLDLSSNKLTGSIPILTFPVLNILDLNQNHLMGPIPSALGSCHSLIKLDLSRNRLSGPVPDSIGDLTNLILMDLSYNTLSGPLPETLGTLKSLQGLILKGNPTISTTIPNHGFDGLKDLTILVLSDMNLVGPIPDSLARLPNLRVLHLDGNQLNGSVPKSFRDANNLSELRLNNNRLSGPIPLNREMVWRMRRKLKVYNNSGLCYEYEPSSGIGDDLDSAGIGQCGSSRPDPSKTVQHLSTIDRNMQMTTLNKSSAVVVYKFSLLGALIQLTTLLMFVLALF